jgi:hypothetical protein
MRSETYFFRKIALVIMAHRACCEVYSDTVNSVAQLCWDDHGIHTDEYLRRAVGIVILILG